MRAIFHLINDYAESTPRYNTGHWQWILRDPRFSVDKELIEENPHTVLRDGIYDRVLSTSFIAKMSDTEKHNLRCKIGAILDACLTALPSDPAVSPVSFWHKRHPCSCRALCTLRGKADIPDFARVG